MKTDITERPKKGNWPFLKNVIVVGNGSARARDDNNRHSKRVVMGVSTKKRISLPLLLLYCCSARTGSGGPRYAHAYTACARTVQVFRFVYGVCFIVRRRCGVAFGAWIDSDDISRDTVRTSEKGCPIKDRQSEYKSLIPMGAYIFAPSLPITSVRYRTPHAQLYRGVRSSEKCDNNRRETNDVARRRDIMCLRLYTFFSSRACWTARRPRDEFPFFKTQRFTQMLS